MSDTTGHSPEPLTAGKIASVLKGELHGKGEISISAIKPLAMAGESDLSFLAPTSKKQKAELFELAKASKAGAVLVSEALKDISCTQIVVKNPLQSVIVLSEMFFKTRTLEKGIHPTAVIDKTASIGAQVSIGAYAVIGADVTIGDGAQIYPHVVIYRGATIGKNTIIHSGAVVREFCTLGEDCFIQNGSVIGADGFGYIPDKEIGHRRIPHIGVAVLEDRVDMGANSTIDRAMLGETRLKKAVKLDNLVMVGHNVSVGERTIMCAQVGVSGSSTIGSDVILAGQVGVADHVKVCDGVRAGGKTGIERDVTEKMDIAGFPWRRASTWRRIEALINRLPQLFKKLRLEDTAE